MEMKRKATTNPSGHEQKEGTPQTERGCGLPSPFGRQVSGKVPNGRCYHLRFTPALEGDHKNTDERRAGVPRAYSEQPHYLSVVWERGQNEPIGTPLK